MLLHGRHAYILLTIFLTCIVSTRQTQGNKTTRKSQISNTTEPSSILSGEDIEILVIATVTVASIGALLNAAVILAIVIDPLKSLRKGAWITILNLAIADMLSCVSCICLWGRHTLFPAMMNSKEFSAICNFGWGSGVAASFLLLTFFTIQIFVITKFPLKSRFMFTDLKILLATLGIWLFAFVLGLAILAYLYFPGTRAYKFYVARIGVLQVALCIQIILNLQVSVEIMKSGRSAGNDSCQNKKHRNIAKTVIMLTLILFFTAFPYFIFKQMEYFVYLGYFGDSNSSSILQIISYCYAPIAILNFTANPILYSLRLPDYRKTLLAVVGKSKRKRGTHQKINPNTLSGTNQFSLQGRSSSPRSSVLAASSTPLKTVEI